MTDYLYHAAPLHYLPHILESGALYPQSVLAAWGIRPRRTAARRDRMLGLADWVHLSLTAETPLLRDKLRRGYPHALLAFDREAVLGLPGVALLPGNAKAWRSRAALQPVTDAEEKAALWRRHFETGRFPSLEVLVQYGLDLALLEQIAFTNDTEREKTSDLLASLNLTPPVPLSVRQLPSSEDDGAATWAYFADCRAAGRLLPPPDIPFD